MASLLFFSLILYSYASIRRFKDILRSPRPFRFFFPYFPCAFPHSYIIPNILSMWTRALGGHYPSFILIFSKTSLDLLMRSRII
ncbi:hypothetical protein SISSUDRAFT_561916 [Sistotremastrum suecicum HHB10207 ss-3]|uniref:Cytochrome P450 n=1 Tax=Sistotremastrum suecicum HHB10207 ss-3 TaxID=1314776 RepID=A0A166ESP3_9AGAM|nr:hypothetical protein SISSUDRAFT_561916 [Sistotremastrum suecicum HHB10207 ss-3]